MRPANRPLSPFVFFFLAAFTLLLSPARAAGNAQELVIRNASLVVRVQPSTGTFSVEDLRTHTIWNQRSDEDFVTTKAYPQVKTAGWTGSLDFQSASTPAEKPGTVELKGTYRPSNVPFTCTITLDGDKPEIEFSLSATGEMPYSLTMPHAFTGGKDLILPINEGVRYPVNDSSIKPSHQTAYSAFGLCMPFWGLTDADGQAGQMTIIETPYDGGMNMNRDKKGLAVSVLWDPEKGAFGYDRKLRYIFFDKGGYVAMCKRYREYAQQKGLVKTLAEKRKTRPNIDKLVGAVNIWCWDNDPVSIIKEMQEAGIKDILWSRTSAPRVAEVNALGVLSSRYDSYYDVIDPALVDQLTKPIDVTWVQAAWPDKVIFGKDGKWLKSWWVTSKTGTRLDCAVCADAYTSEFATQRIGDELKTAPYTCRFIDDETASTLLEDYGPGHEQTRTVCAQRRSALLDLVSDHFGLVTGSETGMDWGVPHLDYFEGMESLTYYRLPGAGHSIKLPVTENVPEELTKFQTGPFYRLPLFELVYHDCVVSTWYWYDASDSVTPIWNRRDLLNILYGTQPMFRVERPRWQAEKDRYVQTCKTVCPVERQVAYTEMVDHQWLTPDALVQQSSFSNGTVITVNFGTEPYKKADGGTIEPGGYFVTPAKG